MARNYVSSAAFVAGYLRTHKAGGTMADLAADLGMNKSSATVKASQLRQAGIQLPKLKQLRAKLDLGVLAMMVKNYEDGVLDLDGKNNVTISDHLEEDVEDNTEFFTPQE
jgi:hypothetical protein